MKCFHGGTELRNEKEYINQVQSGDTLLKTISPLFYIKEIQGEAGNKMKEHLTHVGAVLILFTTEDTEDAEVNWVYDLRLWA